jgi:hypothetical protein
MRWLILTLLVSLAVLLLAAAGLARHIWVQHKRGETESGSGIPAKKAPEAEADDESKN